jgi:hypothetical protein
MTLGDLGAFVGTHGSDAYPFELRIELLGER